MNLNDLFVIGISPINHDAIALDEDLFVISIAVCTLANFALFTFVSGTFEN